MTTPSSRQAATALLTEHLRYTPLALIDDIINTINELTNRAIDAAEKGLLSADPSTLGFAAAARTLKEPTTTTHQEAARAEIEEGVHQLETLMESTIDHTFDKFEIVALRGILAVDAALLPHLTLPHYAHVPRSPSHLPALDALDALAPLLRQVQETRRLRRALQATAARNDKVLARLRGLVAQDGPLGFLVRGEAARGLGMEGVVEGWREREAGNGYGNASASADGNANPNGVGTREPGVREGPLTTNMSFALAQLPELQSLLEQLRPTLEEIGAAAQVPAPEGEVAKERRAYVENQARRALARQGLGGTADGASESLGRVVSMDEVNALEDVVNRMEE